MRIAIVFAQFGPYHHARVGALQARAEASVIPVQIARETSTYAWKVCHPRSEGLMTLCEGQAERVAPLTVFLAARRLFRSQGIQVAMLPSYAPAAEFAVFLAAKSLGLRTVMMNESHAGTARATGLARLLKRLIVGSFDAGLVGGTPHVAHFVCLGMKPESVFKGYDAVDNHYFQERSDLARADASATRQRLGLPMRYFLNLGRFVAKKNLETLVRAYAAFCSVSGEEVALALVGDGPEAGSLRKVASDAGLRVHEATEAGFSPAHLGRGDVIFYGFRQYEDNAAFYGLAELFVLPSFWEEWGLVVNEAMACGLPVLVSHSAGCARDLVESGRNGYAFDHASVSALATHLTALAADAPLRREMGEASRMIIQEWGCERFAEAALQACAFAAAS